MVVSYGKYLHKSHKLNTKLIIMTINIYSIGLLAIDNKFYDMQILKLT